MDNEINFYFKSYEYGFLSNFWSSPMVIDGKEYPTNEHYYQSQKSVKPEQSEWIRQSPTAYLAMKAGRSLRLNKGEVKTDWDKIKFFVMLNGLRAKFIQNIELGEKLLATGDTILHEDSPTDMVWGKKGMDMLGKLLMQVRSELKSTAIL
jgi:ribA/ribD-fused uncharacterized protein